MQTLHEQEPTAASVLPVPFVEQQQEQTSTQKRAIVPRIPRKRLVSKSVYVTRQAVRIWIALIAVAVLLGAVVSAGYFAYCFSKLGVAAEPMNNLLLSLLVFSPLVYIGSRQARKGLRVAAQIEPGVPLTRANTADLPAPDSLVRASQEPAQAQESVLLRAASGEAQAGQEGQLLRASAGE